MNKGNINIKGEDDFKIRKALDFLKEIAESKTVVSEAQTKEFINELEIYLEKYLVMKSKFYFLLEKATQKVLVELQKEELK